MARMRCTIGALLLLTAAAGAQEGTPLERARVHFQSGKDLYDKGDYQHGLDEFLAANELAPHRAFLLNVGQCYRKLGDLKHALDFYQKYLFQSSSDDPWEPKVRQYAAEVRAELAARSTPPASNAEPVAAPAQQLQPTRAPSSVTAPPPERAPRPPAWRRAWFWGAIAGVVVAGAALGVGLGVGLSPRAPHPVLGTVTF